MRTGAIPHESGSCSHPLVRLSCRSAPILSFLLLRTLPLPIRPRSSSSLFVCHQPAGTGFLRSDTPSHLPQGDELEWPGCSAPDRTQTIDRAPLGFETDSGCYSSQEAFSPDLVVAEALLLRLQ